MKRMYLLDTNIVSEFSKLRPDPHVLDLYSVRKDLCAISAVSWQEIIRGLDRMPEGKRKAGVQDFVDGLGNNVPVIPYDKFAAGICGELQSRAEQDGRMLPCYDSQIAATALANGMVLVTHNTADFEAMRQRSFLRVEDWFSQAV